MNKLLLMGLGLTLCISSFAQQHIIKGVVKDSQGEPIPGVYVQIKGTTSAVSTDIDGTYTIDVKGADDVLVYSLIGMKTLEMQAGTHKVMDVVMETESLGLDEAIVVGYGVMKKSDLTGSIASVKAEKMLEASSSATFETMLQGRVAGMQVITGNDNPSGGATIRVRGMSSLHGSNSPLVVVDGVPVGDAGALNTLSPSTIKSIEVLKDASSTAIFGSRGANGVIMVTTKKGAEGKMGIYVDYKMTLGDFSKKLDYWRDPILMMELSNEGAINAGVEPTYIGKRDGVTGVYYPSIEEVKSGAWPYFTDWTKYCHRDVSVTNEVSFGLESSKIDSQFRVNGTYYDGEGMKKADDYKKGTVDMFYENKLNDWLALTTRAGFFTDWRNNIHPEAFWRNPLFPVLNPDGTPYKMHSTDYGNPVGTRLHNSNISKSYNGSMTFQLDATPIKQLAIVLRADGRMNYNDNRSFSENVWSVEGTKWNNRASHSRQSGHHLKTEGYATYSDSYRGGHNFSAMLGTELEFDWGYGLSGASSEFSSPTLRDECLGAGSVFENGNWESKTVLVSAFTRLNYNYKSRYYLTFIARADGSSKFGDNNKWAFFPSGAFSWRISEEPFMKDVKSIDNMKIRLSYGVSGNQGISPYQTNTVYGWQWIAYEGQDVKGYGPGKVIGREGLGDRYVTWGGIGNKNLKWEQTAQSDLGFDLNMFDSRLNFTIDVYHKLTTDLLRQQFLAPNTGSDKMWTNDGEIRNVGFDFSLDGDAVRNSDWQLNLGAVFSLNRNRVVSLGDEMRSGLITDASGLKYEPFRDFSGFMESYVSILALGYPVGVFYGYEVDGIVQEDNAMTGDAKEIQPGEFNIIGMREDGTYDPAARKVIGDPNPDFTGSLNCSLKHKTGVDFSFQLYGVFGNDVLSMAKYQSPRLQKDRWTYDHPSTTRPSLRGDRRTVMCDWFLEDGSFLRLQNMTVGYTLPVISFLESARVYFNAANLFTLTKSTLNDPENGVWGLDQPAYPRVATYTFGIQFRF